MQTLTTPQPAAGVNARLVIGIDPGKTGAAVAVRTDTAALWAQRHAEGFFVDKGDYVPAAMAGWLRVVTASTAGIPAALVVLERQHAMPQQGRTSMLTIGVGFGLWWGILAALELPVEFVTAQRWQREVLHGVAGGDTKDRAVRVARARFPALDLVPGKRVRPHEGIADAACLALYGLKSVGAVAAPDVAAVRERGIASRVVRPDAEEGGAQVLIVSRRAGRTRMRSWTTNPRAPRAGD